MDSISSTMAQTIFDDAPIAIAQFSLKGEMIKCNQAFCQMLGYQKQDLIGSHFSKYSHPDDSKIDFKNVENLVADKTASFKREKRYIHKEGHIIWGSIYASKIKDQSIKQPLLLVMITDISEQKELMSMAEDREDSYRNLYNQTPVMMHSIDSNGNLLSVSDRWLEVMGYSRDEVIGKKSTFFLTEESQKYAEEIVLPAFFIEGVCTNVPYQMVTKEGAILDTLLSSISEYSPSGKFVRTLAVLIDVTEQKRLENQILQVQKLESLGLLAGGIAHDFNNLLSNILGNVGLAQYKSSKLSPVNPHLEKIEASTQRAADLCRQLLAYSGKGKFVVQPIDINELIIEMNHMLSISISKNAVIKYNLLPDLPSMEADATQIRQVVMNLIINASEAIEESNGVISVSTGLMHCTSDYLQTVFAEESLQEGFYIYLEVSDTGMGMDKETLHKIFDPFFTTKFQGRGLGLAALLGIVHGHRGAIRVYSELGEGTTFKLLFPSSEKEVLAPPIEHSDVSWNYSGLVLVVDDDEAIRDVAEQTLEMVGFTVVQASDGQEAIDIFAKRYEEVVFILLDMTMPKLSGKQAFREMRHISPKCKIILSSGYNEQEAINQFAGKNLTGFLQKPYLPKTLLSEVQEILQKDG